MRARLRSLPRFVAPALGVGAGLAIAGASAPGAAQESGGGWNPAAGGRAGRRARFPSSSVARRPNSRTATMAEWWRRCWQKARRAGERMREIEPYYAAG